MGFYDSLVHGTEEVVYWVGSNADNMRSAVSAIRNAAGPFGVFEKGFLVNDDNVLPVAFDAARKAEDMLKRFARIRLEGFEDRISASEVDKVTGEDVEETTMNLGGIWLNMSEKVSEEAVSAMAVDLNKFLALYNQPAVIGNGDDAQDLGRLIANIICSPSSNKDLQEERNDGFYVPQAPYHASKPVDIQMAELGLYVMGGQVYYPIPIKDSGNTVAWHFHLWLKIQTNSDCRAKLAATRKALVHAMPIAAPTDDSYQVITVSADWTSSKYTLEIMAAAVNDLIAPGTAYSLQPASKFVNGQKYIYTFNTGLEIKADEVLRDFALAIAQNSLGLDAPKTKVETQHIIKV